MQNSETEFARISENVMYRDQLQLSDAKLQTDDGYTFHVQRVILAKSSDYFRCMFYGMDKERREFRIPGVSGHIFSDILRYVYAGDIRITEGNTGDLIIAADYMLLTDLSMKIKQNIKTYMNEVNCLRIIRAAHQISDEDIFRECFRFIQTRFERVMRCQKNDLADLPLEILISILSNRSLYVYNETTVWQAIVEWTQKDILLRMSYIPHLLLTLAMEDMEEELATEILQHEIISQNSLFRRIRCIRDLQSDQIFKRKKISDFDVLLSFLRSYSTRFMEPNSHRIPHKLHLIFSRTEGEYDAGNPVWSLHTTYDENLDLWRKIAEVGFEPNALIAIRHNIYILNCNEFVKFDLRAMDWVRMNSAKHKCVWRYVGTIDDCIYILNIRINGYRHQIKVYNTVNNRWLHDISLPLNICNFAAVAIKENIYIVGNIGKIMWHIGTVMQMFDTVTQQWSHLSPPNIISLICFRLVAYHQKIYLINHNDSLNSDVFDPATNLWKQLPDLPYTYLSLNYVILNDQLIFYDCDTGDQRNTKSVRWDDGKECWEKLDTTYLEDLLLLRKQPFCTVEDVETIKMITKQNRDHKTKAFTKAFSA